jgi:hypothetical protein
VVLDEFLPAYDVNEVHTIATTAQPGAVMDAVRTVTAREVPLLVALMAIRTVPALLSLRRVPRRGPLLEDMRRAGFVSLSEAPDELVLGVVGRFWTPSGGVRRIEPGEFGGFDEAGFAKAVFNFEVEPTDRGTLMRTETRILATDERARRRFGLYWRIVQPGSGLIRIAWLRAIRRRAERTRLR